MLGGMGMKVILFGATGNHRGTKPEPWLPVRAK